MHLEDKSWMNIARFAASHDHTWTYIILGRSGPTGKTYMRNRLKENGYNAVELTESLYRVIGYIDEYNHYIVDEVNKTVTIVLNKLRPEFTKCRKCGLIHRAERAHSCYIQNIDTAFDTWIGDLKPIVVEGDQT